MVGQPKHLHDLSKIEADVRLTCRRCGYEDDWTVGELSAHVRAIGGNPTWSECARLVTCRRHGCGATNPRASIVPFARRQANLPRQISKLDAHMVETTLAILRDAVLRSKARAVASIDVRLALLVVLFYTRDRELVRRFWARASSAEASVSDTLLDRLTAIEHRLVKLGWLAPPVLIARPQIWQWQSPAPPGWIPGAGAPAREPADDGPDA